MRKKRNVRRVMGWLLSFQLSDPAAGACCAFSIAGGGMGAWLHVLRGIWVKLAALELFRVQERVGESASAELECSPHVIGCMKCPRSLSCQLHAMKSFPRL
jgi:hypothetical protein